MDKIVVIDYGSNYNEMLIRQLRDEGVYSVLLPHRATKEDILNLHHVKGIILSGGPCSVHDAFHDEFDSELLELNIPILGICYGMHILAEHLGGKIKSKGITEYGKAVAKIDTKCPLFYDIPDETVVWMSHEDYVSELTGVSIIAETNRWPISGFQKDNLYGVQFHPEVVGTEFGVKILSNFINICQAARTWDIVTFLDEKVKEIQETVGNHKVLLALSGGAASAVAALVLHKAIGDKLECIFIDNGLFRKNEVEHIMDMFETKFPLDVRKVDSQDVFVKRLKGVKDPEDKRRIVGLSFFDIFKAEARKIKGLKFLAEGNLYRANTEAFGLLNKKLVDNLDYGKAGYTLLEPLADLYKDEVRWLGEKLGLDEIFNKRQPFPSAGMARRIIGEVTKEKLEIIKEADYILAKEIKAAGLRRDIWQYFCVLTNVKSVGLLNRNINYNYTIAIRCITSNDGVSSDFFRFDHETLALISNRLVNEVKGVNRVVYDITATPPSTIEWE